MVTGFKNNKIIFSIMLILVFVSWMIFFHSYLNNASAKSNTNISSQSIAEYNNSEVVVSDVENNTNLCEKALIRLVWKDIKYYTSAYYQDYLTINPTVSDYDTIILSVIQDRGDYEITFQVSPYIGPHLYFAADNIILSLNREGEFKLKEFKHIESTGLPPNYQDLLKKPLP